MEIAVVIAIIAIVFVVRTFKIVPQQHAWVVERLGKYDRTLTPGLKFLIPFIERVAYKHSLKEVPLDVPSQVCITKDNTQLQVDGILFFQITDPMRASYGSSNYIGAITQLAQTTLRSMIGKMELDKTFEERAM
jgi:regulator of protease activity HflC (stomatin/prohibitin superfamily)